MILIMVPNLWIRVIINWRCNALLAQVCFTKRGRSPCDPCVVLVSDVLFVILLKYFGRGIICQIFFHLLISKLLIFTKKMNIGGWAALAVIIFIILLTIIALVVVWRRSRPDLSGLKITDEAQTLFSTYIKKHEIAAEHERRCSGIQDLSRIKDYFQIELLEEDHRDVLGMIQKNNMVFNDKMMQRWIEENYRENYIEKKTTCE